jgi:uncharacterized DUF497 family protein
LTYPIEFEWDEAKNRANQRKHGYSFQQAQIVLEGPDTVDYLDVANLAAEDRFIAVGEAADQLAVVVFTVPDEHRIRIISMRPADKHETKRYQEHLDQYR